MGNLVFQATLGGQVNLVGPNTASTFNLNVPAIAGTLVTTGDTGTVTNTMLAGSIANAKLTNSSLTIGSTSISLGGTSTTLAGLTSVGTTTVGAPSSSNLSIQSNGTTNATLDTTGNLGLGVTPSAWGIGKTLQVNNASLMGYLNRLYANSNIYFDGTATAKYIASDYATSYQQLNGQHQWFNAPSGTAGTNISLTQAMTLDASGNLALGQTSAAGRMDVASTGAQLYLRYTGNSGFNSLTSDVSNNLIFTQFAGERMRLDASGNLGVGTTSPSNILHINKASGGTYLIASNGSGTGAFGVGSGGEVTVSAESASNIIRFLNNSGSTERARIDSSGNLLVGQTATSTVGAQSGFAAYSDGSISAAYSSNASIFSRRTTDGSVIQFRRDSTAVGSISVTGSATAYNTSSDYRLKNISGNLTGYKERIMALQPKQGTWKSDGAEFRGFLAHEFANQYPSLVSGEKDGVDSDGTPQYQGMQAGGSETIADLVALLQEQQAIITQLQADVEALKAPK